MTTITIELIDLLVDGRAILPSNFAITDMCLSSARSRMTKRAFFLSIKADDAIALLEPTYADWVIHSLKDDEHCGSPQDALAEACYPSLRQVLVAPQLLDLVVGHYLLRDLVGPLVSDGSSDVEYWLDEVTSCKLNAEIIDFSGICYSKS